MEAMPKVAHVVASIAEEASGPSYTVPSLCNALAAQGCDTRLLTVGPAKREVTSGVLHLRSRQDFARVPGASQLRLSRGLARQIGLAAQAGCVLHAHGLWLMPNVYPAAAAHAAGVPFVLSPRGMLGAAALRFSSRQKRLMWTALQGAAARRVDCFHATSEEEFEDIRRCGLTQPVAIIPNGIDVFGEMPTLKPGARRILLYLGRLHPKKGLDRLLDAWAHVEREMPEWDLMIAGPSERGYEDALKAQAERLGLQHVNFVGPRYGADKTALYRAASLFVLPTLNENFGMTVAEALSLGVPVLSTRGAPWAGLETHGCGWWVEGDVASLSGALRVALMTSPQTLADMGQCGRAWMQRDFSWTAIARDMISVYQWLRSGGQRPDFVRVRKVP